MTGIPSDPLPLEGEQTLDQFCTRVLKSGRSRNASAIISKIELLKDMRTTDDYWRHEFLVFTIHPLNGEDNVVVYFERGLANDGTWLDFLKFVWAGMKGGPSDLLTCYTVGSHEDQDRRSWATSIIEVHLRRCSPGPLRLRHLARVLSSEDYSEKYPDYRLLSANCWAWARGVLFDVIRHPSTVPSEVMMFDRPSSALGRDVVTGRSELSEDGQRVLSKEEVELEILTNYGAYGRALLHFSSENFRSRYPLYPYIFHRILIRFILVVYSLIDIAASIRNSLGQLAHSNWAICLRTMHIFEAKTTDEKGWDFTSTHLPPNFGRLVPATNAKAFKDPNISNSMCAPGRYLYLLTPPLAASCVPCSVKSIHVYVFGSISQTSTEAGGVSIHEDGREKDRILRQIVDDGTNPASDLPTWLSCAVILPSSDGASIRDVTEPVRLCLLPRVIVKNELHYSAMCIFDDRHVLAGSLRSGDVLGLWAHGHPRLKHTVRIASIKIVTRRPVGILDFLLMVYVVWWIDQLLRVGFSARLVYGIAMCIPYAFNTRFEGWVWNNINVFSTALHAAVARS